MITLDNVARLAYMLGVAVYSHPEGVCLRIDAAVYVADIPTAALMLLGHARGLRLDLGECPACRVRGSKRGLARWEWKAHAWTGPGCEDFALNGAAHWIRLGFAAEAIGGTAIASRPCPACTVDGKPTGRETIAWVQAIAQAAPRKTCEDWMDGDACRSCECVDCDPVAFAAREHTRTTLAVQADKMQATGDDLGRLLASWLRGGTLAADMLAEPCSGCEGHGTVYRRDGAWVVRSQMLFLMHGFYAGKPCPHCSGQGSVFGRLQTEALAAFKDVAP